MKQNFYVLITCIILFFSVFNAYSQEDTIVRKIIEIGKADNRTMDHLDVLCNRFGGRPIGSDAYDNAVKWSEAKFKEWGMKVVLDEIGELPVGFNRGPWFGRMLGGDGMTLHFATPSYTSGTKGVQRGHVVIEPKTQAEFDRMKGKLKGAWVLISGENNAFPIDHSANANKIRDSIIAENNKIAKYNSELRHRYREKKSKDDDRKPKELIEEPALFYRQMKEAGILGIIQSAPVPIKVQYDRKNIMDLTFESLPEIPDIRLDEHQFKIIEQMAKERRYFELEFDIRNHFRIGPVKYYNVIGIIEGTDYPDEYVIMGGHLDSYDVATGGVDNGSGVTPAIEAARLIMESGAKPKRTILVILWGGEEFGLLGSTYWVNENEDKLGRISNMFNRDGGPTVPSSLEVSEAMWEDFEKICHSLDTINPDFPFELKKRKARKRPKKAWGTDSGPFAVKGVPTITFRTHDPKGYDFNYREIWHTERDLYNMSIPEYQEHTAILTAIVVLGVANLDHLLSREGYYLPEN